MGGLLPLLCPNSAEVRTYLQRWITTVAEVLQADAIFWDEPHFYIPLGESRTQGLWSCCCTRCQEHFRVRYGQPLPPTETAEVRQCKQAAMAQLISDVTAMAAGHGLQNIVCILPEHDDLEGLQTKCDLFAANPHLDILATDPYPLWHRRDIAHHAGLLRGAPAGLPASSQSRADVDPGLPCAGWPGTFTGRGNAPDGQVRY